VLVGADREKIVGMANGFDPKGKQRDAFVMERQVRGLQR